MEGSKQGQGSLSVERLTARRLILRANFRNSWPMSTTIYPFYLSINLSTYLSIALCLFIYLCVSIIGQSTHVFFSLGLKLRKPTHIMFVMAVSHVYLSIYPSLHFFVLGSRSLYLSISFYQSVLVFLESSETEVAKIDYYYEVPYAKGG